MNKLVEHAPCVFCGYSGAGFFQAGTHDKDCPWFSVGGGEKRSMMLREVIAALFKERRHSSHNTGSPKLPHCNIFVDIADDYGVSEGTAIHLYNWFVRQLRANA